MQDMDLRLVYITAKDENEARTIGKALIEEKLAACVNIHPQIQSLYKWKGELHDEKEVVIIAKTTAAKMGALIEKVKSIHSYECPCIVSVPLAEGNEEFLQWIEEATNN